MATVSNPTGASGGDASSNQRAIQDLQGNVQQQQTQQNTAPSYFGITGKFPVGAPPGSMAARQLSGGQIAISISAQKGFGQEVIIKNPAPPEYQGFQTGAGAPSVATNFPTAGQYGWYFDTVASRWYWTGNYNGNLAFQDLATLLGTISDTQHGARGGGTLHPVVTTTVNGFQAATDKVIYDAAVSKLNDITSTGAVAFFLNGTQLLISGVSVLTGRITATPDLLPADTLATVIARINTFFANVRARNLMNP